MIRALSRQTTAIKTRRLFPLIEEKSRGGVVSSLVVPAPTTTIRTASLSSTAVSSAVPPSSSKNREERTQSSSRRRTFAVDEKDPLIVTERAAQRIQELIRGQPHARGIKLGVKRRGCNGLSYTLNYATDEDFQKKGMVQMESSSSFGSVTVLIEPMALFNVVGTTMDWVETELTSEFTFENPNSKGECGCGESFTV